MSIRKAERQLALEWKRAIQVAENRIHRRAHQAWSAKVDAGQKRHRLLKIITPIAALFLCSCAGISSFFGIGLLSGGMAIFISLTLLGFLIVQTMVLENLEKKPPVKGAEGRKLLNITGMWWNRLKPSPMEIRVDGDIGEKALLDTLENRLSNQFIGLHQYMVLRNLDADILLLGPNGIWLLESKYHSGRIICRNGHWYKEKSYYGPGGIPETDSQPWKPYDEQWLHEKRSITQTILRRLPQDMHWVADEIRGGLVFTHNNVSLEIDSSCQVEYGNISYWVKKISAGQAVPNLTTGTLLSIVDALLVFANEISAETSDRSAKQLAMDVYQKAERDIPAFVKANL